MILQCKKIELSLNEVLCGMQNKEGDANFVDIDELGSDVGPDDDYEAQIFPLFDPLRMKITLTCRLK